MVDDILAFEALFNAPGHFNDYEKRWATPLVYAEEELKPLNIENNKKIGITRSQLHKFAAQFDENTTWEEFFKMEEENYEQVRDTVINGLIVEGWDYDEIPGKSR